VLNFQESCYEMSTILEVLFLFLFFLSTVSSFVLHFGSVYRKLTLSKSIGVVRQGSQTIIIFSQFPGSIQLSAINSGCNCLVPIFQFQWFVSCLQASVKFVSFDLDTSFLSYLRVDIIPKTCDLLYSLIDFPSFYCLC
jgi:hypothetical protein